MLLFKYAVKMNERLRHIIRLIYRNKKHEQKGTLNICTHV